MRAIIDNFDNKIARWMERYGHFAHRISLALLFIWFGSLKGLGYETTTTILAKTVYWGDPMQTVHVLGVWEVLIGATLMWRPLIRVALFLLAVRLPGTFLALLIHPDVCFADSVFVPTPEGQYLIKDLILFSAAMVIGGTVRHEAKAGVLH